MFLENLEITSKSNYYNIFVITFIVIFKLIDVPKYFLNKMQSQISEFILLRQVWDWSGIVEVAIFPVKLQGHVTCGTNHIATKPLKFYLKLSWVCMKIIRPILLSEIIFWYYQSNIYHNFHAYPGEMHWKACCKRQSKFSW